MPNKKKYPYELPVLHHYNGDVSKRWYIEWKAWNIRDNKLQRQRFWNLNREKNPEKRYLKAYEVINEVTQLLEQGMVYDPESVSKNNSKKHNNNSSITPNTPFLVAYREYMSLKSADCSEIYISLLRTSHNRLRRFLKMKGKERITLMGLSTQLLDDYILWLKKEFELDNNTLAHSKIPNLKSVINHYYKKLGLPKNPVKNLNKFKPNEPLTEIYTDEEAKEIFAYTKEYFPHMYLLINFIYYSCIRPKELRYLKIKNIQEDHIIIPGKVKVNDKIIQHSKNSKTQLVRIFPGLGKVIGEFNLRSYPPEYFIFSRKLKPGDNLVSRGFMNLQYRPIRKRFDLPVEKNLYNWKHTGAVKIYQRTKDIKFVQRHLRHASVQTTEMYLRKLMLLDDDYKEVDIDIF